MLCHECNRENKPGAQFCGFCGQQFQGLLTEVTETTAGQAQVKRRGEHLPSVDSHLATTRWLCAAVTLDTDLGNSVIEQVLEEEQRAVVTTPGVDLVTVLKYALAAHRRQVITDVILAVDLIAIITTVVTRIYPLVVLLLFASWVTVFVQTYTSKYGRIIEGLQSGQFDPAKAYSPPPGSFAGRQLERFSEIGTAGNVTFSSSFSPFQGYGTSRSSWSFAIDITRAPNSVTRPGTRGRPKLFSALDVYDYIKDELSSLDLPGMEFTDRLFVNGRDIYGDERFLPRAAGPPVTSVDPELIRELLAEPEEWARPYLTMGQTSWQGDLVVTSFIRFLVTGSDLFVEAAHTVVPPLRAEFRDIDVRELTPDFREFLEMATQVSVATLGRLLGSIPRLVHEMRAESRRAKKRRRVARTRDYGALASVRELAADTKWHRYFQIFDDEHFVKVTEQRIFRALIDFLKEHNVDTSSLESRAETLINNGVMFGDNAKVENSQVGGSGTRISGIVSRIRGKESAEAAS